MPWLLMTRPKAESDRFVAGMDPDVRDRVRVVTSPLMTIETLPVSVDMTHTSGVIFTSANGIRAAADLGVRPSVPCFCVGQRTTSVATASGWSARLAGADADALVDNLVREQPSGEFVHLRGQHARGDIAKRLSASGIHCQDIAIYAQNLLPLTDTARKIVSQDEPVIVPLFSPRTARQFAEQVGIAKTLWVVAMSQAVADEVNTLNPKKIFVAREPNAKEMVECIAELARNASTVEGQSSAQ